MTDKLTYQDILALDAARTQGDWEFHDGGRKNDWSESSWVQIPEHFDDNGNDSDDVIYLRLTANAQYIAAMPQAVEMLKRFHTAFVKLSKLPPDVISGEAWAIVTAILQEEQKG